MVNHSAKLFCKSRVKFNTALIGLPKSKTADSAQPRNCSTVTRDPFWVGSRDETTRDPVPFSHVIHRKHMTFVMWSNVY